MYISKEEWDIYYQGKKIEDVVDIDIQEQQLSRQKGISKYRDTVLVLHLSEIGKMHLIADSAELFHLKKKPESQNNQAY